MKRRLGRLLTRWKYLIRTSHPFLKTAFFASLVLIGYLLFLFPKLFAQASTNSIQAGLTLTTEIVGVLLGAILVIVVLLIDQKRQAAIQLSAAYPKYRGLASKNARTIVKARKETLDLVLQRKVGLNDALMPKIRFRNVVEKSYALCFGLNTTEFWDVKTELEAIGYSPQQALDLYLEVGSDEAELVALFAEWSFCLSLVGLDMYSKAVDGLADKVFDETLRDGTAAAVHRFKTSGDFISSWTLSVTIAVQTLTLLLGAFTLFGLTEANFAYPIIVVPTNLAIAGFVLSIALFSLSIRKMFEIG